MSQKILNGFCPKCMMKHKLQEGESKICKCGYEFRQFECDSCKKSNFFPGQSFKDDQLYKCANESCKAQFAYSQCSRCTVYKKLKLNQLKDITDVIEECQVCEDLIKYSVCPDCSKISQISIKDISPKDKLLLYQVQQSCSCGQQFVNTSCPSCQSLLCFIKRQPSEGLGIQCSVCNQSFSFVRGECCQKMIKGEPAKCFDCSRDTFKVICPKCQKFNQLSEKQISQLLKGSPIGCKTSSCKGTLSIKTLQIPKKITLNEIKIIKGDNVIVEYKEPQKQTQGLSPLKQSQTIQQETPKQKLEQPPQQPQLKYQTLQVEEINQSIQSTKVFKCLKCNKQTTNANPILVPCGHQDTCLDCVEIMQNSDDMRCPNCQKNCKSVFKEVSNRNFHQEILEFIQRERRII